MDTANFTAAVAETGEETLKTITEPTQWIRITEAHTHR